MKYKMIKNVVNFLGQNVTIGGTFTDDGVAEASANDVCTVSYGRFMRAATADEATYSASTFEISTTHKTDPNS